MEEKIKVPASSKKSNEKTPGGRCRNSDAQLSETYEYGTCPDGLSDLRRAGRDI